jgi:hypothetical protein
MISPEPRALRDVMRTRLTFVSKRSSARNSIHRLLEKYNASAPSRSAGLGADAGGLCFEEQIALLTRQIKALEHALLPELLPTQQGEQVDPRSPL